ncbi:MAG: hypothetical protein V4722_23740 [Bacteroidota bacterium]
MKIELLLRQYLYNHKTVTYPGIGKLVFGSNAQLPDSLEKGEAFPLQDLNFSFNLNEPLDMDFVAFVSSQTGKIAPLAMADVESYFMLSKQFINIGKSFVVEGIGSVDKQDNGSFAFTPGYFLPVSEASAAPHKPLKIREAVPVMPKTDTKKTSPTLNKKPIMLIIGILLLGVVIYGIYRIAFAKKENAPGDKPVTAVDTTAVLPIDTLNAVRPSLPVSVGAGYKAIVDQRFSRAAANVRAAKLKSFGHDAQVDSISPSNFLIYIPVKDTTVSVDSLQLIKINGKRPRFVPMQ